MDSAKIRIQIIKYNKKMTFYFLILQVLQPLSYACCSFLVYRVFPFLVKCFFYTRTSLNTLWGQRGVKCHAWGQICQQVVKAGVSYFEIAVVFPAELK